MQCGTCAAQPSDGGRLRAQDFLSERQQAIRRPALHQGQQYRQLRVAGDSRACSWRAANRRCRRPNIRNPAAGSNPPITLWNVQGSYMAVKVGDKLPPIVAETQNGSLNLENFRGAKSVVLWVYPKDMTSG